MPTFLCKARDREGRLVTERVEAASRTEAAEGLERRGFLPVAIEPERTGTSVPAAPRGRGRRAPPKELALSTRQLATLLRAGVVVHTAIDTVATQCENPVLRQAFEDIGQEVIRGSALAHAMTRHPRIFNPAYINAIEAGQLSGRLDTVLTRMATYMEVALKRRAGVKTALRYPVIVMATFAAAFFFLIRFVLPNFISLFNRFQTDLPFPTRVLIACHSAFTTYVWVTAGALAAGGAGLAFLLGTPTGKRLWDRTKLSLPIVGPLFTKSSISTFVQTFNTLNEAGVPILQNLDTSSQAIGNTELEALLKKARAGVEGGEPLSKQLRAIPQFPLLVAQMFAVGEKSGRMAEILDPLVAYYDHETEQLIEGLTAAIEPILTILMGAMVLFLALGIFLPTWQLLHMVQQKPA